MPDSPPALVVTGHLSLVRSLGRRGIDVWCLQYDDSQTGHRSRHAAGEIAVPSPMSQPDEFIDALFRLDRSFDDALLIPMFDSSLIAISKHRDALSERFTVATEPWDVTSIYLEKQRTADLAKRLGIPAPRSVDVTSTDDIAAAVDGLTPPFILKPNLTHAFNDTFGTKMFHADTSAELTILCGEALDHGFEVAVQEFVPGPPSAGLVYAGYFVNGKPLVEMTHRKVRDGPPVYGSPRVAVTDTIPEIMEPSRELMAANGFTGYACIEYKQDERDGLPKLMEVNARHNLAGAIHTANGVDIPWIQYRHLVLGEHPTPVSQPPDGRYWVDIQRDIGYSIRERKSESWSAADYLRPYRRRTSYRTFSWSDPMPFLAALTRRAAGPVRSRLRG